MYGTYFGQNDGPQSISEHVDGGTSRYDRNGIIYQAICNCADHSVSPFHVARCMVAQKWNGWAGCNLAAVKIALILPAFLQIRGP